MKQALEILEHTFGYSSFRGRQNEIVAAVIDGANTLVVMPTGAGKSLCYQIPALCRPGMGVVVSPLIALMQDQVSALQTLGVRAAFLNSTLALDQIQTIERDIRNGEIDILYVAPERLLQDRTLAMLTETPLSLIAIDEAHCVAQWGHDFRADYLRLECLDEHFPHVPRVALTATADAATQQEILSRLKLDADSVFICGFDRPNIQYRIEQKNKPRQQLLRFLRDEQQGQAGIVYCLSRKKVDEVALWLRGQGFDALPYHAGMSAEERKQYQDKFLREESVVIVATIAFGMGIDKPNVRFVAHMDMPKSVEAYYQETGRAGRDGEPAIALLLYGMEDVVKLSQMAGNSQGSEQYKMHERQRLNSMLGLCEMTACRRQALLRYFGEGKHEACGNCDNCLFPPETWEATELVQKALSCVFRTEQRFGAAHVIDVLRGSDNEKVTQFGHQQLSTWGIGKDLSVNAWRSIFRQLIVMGFLTIDPRGYGNLQLTEKCRPVLRGEQPVFLRRDMTPPTPIKKARSSLPTELPEQDLPLWNALRMCRKQFADEASVPPYIIFNDATLKEFVVRRPMNLEEMLGISGVGDKKLEKYGREFLDVIRDYEYVNE